jgi:bacteriorhodopsin
MKDRVIKWILRNPTKITGAIIVVIGALQTNTTALQALMTPKQFAWFTVGAGAFVALLGFVNTLLSNQDDDNGQESGV